MSLVGSCPEISEVFELYGAHCDEYLSVKPGITCLSKCTGRDKLTMRESIELDIQYIHERGFIQDLRILLGAVLGDALIRESDPGLDRLQQQSRRAIVEAPFAFFEEQVKVMGRDAVVLAQMLLGLIPEVFDAVDVPPRAGGERFGMVDPMMMEARDIEDVVAAEGIGIDHRIEFDFGLDDRQQRRRTGVGDHRGVDPAAPLENAEDRCLSRGATASLAFPDAAEVALVQLDLALQRAVVRNAFGNDQAKAMVEQGSGVLVDADQIRSRARRRPGDEVLTQSQRLDRGQLGVLEPHATILRNFVS